MKKTRKKQEKKEKKEKKLKEKGGNREAAKAETAAKKWGKLLGKILSFRFSVLSFQLSVLSFRGMLKK